MDNKKFLDGIWVNEADKAPDFVKYSILIDVRQFKKALDKYKNKEGKVKVDIKESKKGNHYMEVNDFKGDKGSSSYDSSSGSVVEDEDEIDVDNIDFS